MNTTSSRRGTTGAALTISLAVAAGAFSTAPAHAASSPWVKGDHALSFRPAASVDAEITVTELPASGAGIMRSFTTAGAPVAYATDRIDWRDFQWGPGGDVVSATDTGKSDFEVIPASPTTREFVELKAASRPAQWTPDGDGLTTVTGAAGSYAPGIRWAGDSNRVQTFPRTSPSVNPGAGAATPDGKGLVIVMAGTEAGTTDLGLQPVNLPLVANTALQETPPAATALGYSALKPHDPAVANDGTLAFVGDDGTGAALFVDEGSGAKKVADLGASCEGQRPSFAPSASALAYVKALSSDCSKTELRTLTPVGGTFVGGTDALVATAPEGSRYETASWRAKTPAAHTERLGGKDRIDVAIAASRWAYPEADSAPGVVIASSAIFSDAVIASPLSGQTDMPLLLNPQAKIDNRVNAEINRLLKVGGLIYVVGGPASVGDGVLKFLSANYTVVRLDGPDRYTTSVEVAKELDLGWAESGNPPRHTAFLADGTNFPDALVAGPAASRFLAPVLLTNGSTMPTSVKNYVNGRSAITRVYSVGGAAAQADNTFGAKATGIVGKDRYEVSQKVAKQFFPGAKMVGAASGQVFPDALTGGALTGIFGQPLVLVTDKAVPATVAAQLVQYRSAADAVMVFGGSATVGDQVKSRLTTLAGTQTVLGGWEVPTVANTVATGLAQGRAGSVEVDRSSVFRSAHLTQGPEFSPRAR